MVGSSGNPANAPQQATVCQIQENLRMYDGKVVAIQVVNLDLKGSGGAKVAGSGGTELSLSGTANLKGPTVNIN